ncbi:MAG: hypothetical protein CR975_04465 [Gammaproteobacteria bacterium]|nr:MAG: hypothetical protein CR975_04465 [Gammaproteobacteria bacterium]
MAEQNVIDVIIVTEQLAQIDFIEKVLKKNYVINTYQANQINEVKRILDFEKIELIIIDDAEGTLGVGSVRSAVKDLRLQTPILQLVSADSSQAFGTLMRNGASIVCPKDDGAAITANVSLLLNYSESQSKVEQDSDMIDDYRHKFDDLYQGLADPICYLHDGVFVDCNPAFLRAFSVSNKEELQEMTIMHFVNPKYQTEVKSHLRKSTRRDLSSTPVVFQMQTKLGNQVEYAVMSKPTKFKDEDVVQVYMRSTKDGGGSAGTSLYDETTGLANREQMEFILRQKVEEFNNRGGKGILAYIFITNYRDVWGSDGFSAAEKFISATAGFVRQNMPSRAEISRYTDDGLLLFIPNVDNKEADSALKKIVRGLDGITPAGMERMVEPICYVGFDRMDKNSDCQALISQVFRAARGAFTSGSSRVAVPSSTEVAQKDSKRLEILQNALSKERMQLRYQPVVNFSADEQRRYADRIKLFDEENNALDLELMLGVAERYQLAHHIDKWKITQILNKLLEMSRDERQGILIFTTISMDSLKGAHFTAWLGEQIVHTGLSGEYFVFEITADNVLNAYSGAKNFVETMRQKGAKIAISKLGNLSKDNARIIDEIKPEVIKLDMREIDTLDAMEEKETMEDILEKAKSCQATLVAENIQSAAQLARVWPYGVTIAQGRALVPSTTEMNCDFAEFYLLS